MRPKPSSKWKRRFIPRLERLEDRTVPATVNVSNIQQLQQAIVSANNFDTIVMQPGTYAPAGTLPGNFIELNTTLANAINLTIQAATPGTAMIDGSTTTSPVQMIDFTGNPGSQIQFQGIVFQNAGNANPALGGAATIINASVTFTDCTFQNNVNQGQGGALFINGDSTVHFNGCTFTNNESAINGGALFIQNSGGSVPTVIVDESIFTANDTTKLPGVLPETQGGAIEVAVGNLTVNNTTFDNNQANNDGGAIGIIGNEQYNPLAVLNVSNCTFKNNLVVQNPQNKNPTNLTGGAIAMDTGATADVVLSRFTDNNAPGAAGNSFVPVGGGGAISAYRDALTVDQCYFQGNSSTLNGEEEALSSFGGAISVTSQSTAGSFALPKGSLTITNSFIQGYADPSQTRLKAAGGGGIYVAGDSNSFLGQNGVPQNGTLAQNQAQLTVNNVVFDNLTVGVGSSPGGPFGDGGGIEADLANVNIQNALFLNCTATYIGSAHLPIGSGGGLAATTGSTVSIANSTYNNCTAFSGGAVFASVSTLNINSVNFIQNSTEDRPGTGQGFGDGSAVYTSGGNSPPLPATPTGAVYNSTFSLNNGVPIFEDDSNSPANTGMVYDGNQLYAASSNNIVYSGSGGQVDVAGLNTLTVNRVVKSPSHNNVQLPSAPVIGQLWAAPNRVYTISANGDATQGSINEIAWVVSGATSGTIQPPAGSPFPAGSPNGFQQVTVPGTYTLTVPGTSPATVTMIQPTLLIASADAPGGAYIPVFDAQTGAHVRTILAYDPFFSGGARVAMGDVNGDGTPDFIVGPGPGGGPIVEVFDGVTANLLFTLLAIPQSPSGQDFTGGLYVAAGDVTGGGLADIIVGTDAGGGPAVSVFDGHTNLVALFFAFPPDANGNVFTGGVRVAAARLQVGGPAAIATAAGSGGGPFVSIWTYNGNPNPGLAASPLPNGTFAVMPPQFLGGIYIGGGDVQNLGRDLIVSGAGAGGGPAVSVYDPTTQQPAAQPFYAYDPSFTGGVRVAGAPNLILTGAGPNDPSTLGPNAAVFDGVTEALIDRFFAFDPSFTGGIFVASA